MLFMHGRSVFTWTFTSALSASRRSYHITIPAASIPKLSRFSSHASPVHQRSLLYGWGSSWALPNKTLGHARDEPTLSPMLLSEEYDHNPFNSTQTITHVAAGYGHSLIAVKSNSTGACKVHAVGLNSSGQLGIGSSSTTSPTEGVVKGLPQDAEIKGLSCGREHSMVLMSLSDGTRVLYAFGNTMYGQLGIGRSKHDTDPVVIGARLVYEDLPKRVNGYEGCIMTVTCGLDHTVLSTDKSKLYSMGWGVDGQLGLGNKSASDRSSPSLITKLNGRSFRKVTSSTDFTMALLDTGELWTWGNSEYGQCMLGEKIDRVLEPMQVSTKEDVVDVAAGGSFSLFLTAKGEVHVCGYGALGFGRDGIESLSPKRIDGLTAIVKVFATTDYAAAISGSGQLYMWGLGGSSGRLGLGHSEHAVFAPQLVRFPNHSNLHVENVALGATHALALCKLKV